MDDDEPMDERQRNAVPVSERTSRGDYVSRREPEDSEDPRARGKESMELQEEDAAFVLGRGGMTKKKIERACNAVIDVNEREYRIEITGTKIERKRARDYLTFVMQQRVGPVTIDTEQPRTDLTVLSVPEDCVAFVMGRGGQTLRTIEEEWGTLMFFAKVASANSNSEKLMIFGELRARRGAELKVMSAIEHKKPGYYVLKGEDGMAESVRMSDRYEGDMLDADTDWDVDMIPFTSDDFSYALGSQGSTRRKLAKASGCILEYVGMVACIAGTREDRKRCRNYLSWLLKQRTGPVHVEHEGRTDVTALHVPPESVGFITGTRGETLRTIERNTGTFCFTSSSRDGESGRHETLLIFSHNSQARARAREEVEARLHDHAMIQRGGGGMGGPRGGGGGYDRHDRYDRYDDRRDDRRDRYYDDRRERDRYDDRHRDRYDERRRRDDDYDDHRDRRRRDDDYDDRNDRRRRDDYDRYDDRDRRDRDYRDSRHDDRRGRDYDHRR